jgi:uncharacterized protein YjbI with pentapeptide repeats
VDLTEANLCGIALSGANLSGAILAGADLSDADLSDCQIRSSNLCGAKLLRTSLRGAFLNQADLSGAHLEEAQLRRATLSGATLNGATLNGATLKGANLTGVCADDLVARGANFAFAKLDSSRLLRADLSGANLAAVTLTRANCQAANFSRAHLLATRFDGADLAGANLTRAMVRTTSFVEAILHRANLSDLDIWIADFTNAKFRDTVVSPRIDLADRLAEVRYRNLFFTLEYTGANVLSALDTIPADQPGIKFGLMEPIVIALDALPSIADVAPKLAAVLLREKVYSQSAAIRQFMPRLLTAMLPIWNSRLIKADEIDQELALRYLVEIEPVHWTAAPCQGAVNQLLCVPPQANAELIELAALARTAYLSSPTLAPMASALREIDAELCASSYVFVDEDGLRAVVCDPELFKRLRFASPAGQEGGEPAELPWERIWSFARSQPEQRFGDQVNCGTEALLRDYPLLRSAYGMELAPQGGGGLVMASLAGARAYAPRFRAALRSRVLGPDAKLLSWDHAQALHAHFSRFWVDAGGIEGGAARPHDGDWPMLRPEHERELWLAYESMSEVQPPEPAGMPHVPQVPDTPASRARLLLLMAAIYTHLSSSALFGTDYDSPPSLRCHARALLNRAWVLDPQLLDEASVLDWQARLSGVAFPCTSVLSAMMMLEVLTRAAGDEVLARMYFQLYPRDWR